MRLLALLTRVALAGAVSPSRLLFNFTETRHPWANELQVAELRLYDVAGNRIASINTTSPSTTSPYRQQLPFAATDGSVQSKWIDLGFSNNSYSLLYLTPATTATVAFCAPRRLAIALPSHLSLVLAPGPTSDRGRDWYW